GGGFGGGGRQGGGGGFGGGGLGGGAGGQNANLPEGVNQIIALQADNSLLIQATPEAYLRLKEIVKNIDVLPRQVQIKVEFITASVNDIDQFGINFSLVPYPGVSGSSTLINTSVPTYSVGVISGNLVAQIQGALSKGRGKVIQSPTITTTNNTEARIEVQRQIPYTTSQTIIPNSGNTITTTTPQFLTLSTNLDVTPRINNDDTVTLFLTPQIETPGDIPTNGGPPATTRQRIQTLRTIRSGDTMVLGGLITDTESYSQSRIPILSDLPIIGNLFRNRGKNVSNAELLIFVTPTILDANGYATVTGGNSAAISGSVTP
ncbi:MAG: S-protein secretion component, partial [Capsulimonas sp.]|nr:S-protein secretion component [Capsulimonas sp.]